MFKLYVVGLGIVFIKLAGVFMCPVTDEELVHIIFRSGKSNDIPKADFEAGVDETKHYLIEQAKEADARIDLAALGLERSN